MKRISIVALAAMLLAASASQLHATGFEPLGLQGILRITGFGLGQGYHSYPTNPTMQRAYKQAHCQRYPVVPPPAYPCSPRAPEARHCGCNGMNHLGAVRQVPHMMMAPVQMQPQAGTTGHEMTEGPAANTWQMTNEADRNWSEIPATTPKSRASSLQDDMTDDLDSSDEDSPVRDTLPTPKRPKAEIDSAGEDMFDELESYFGDNVGPGPSEQSDIRRLPPIRPVPVNMIPDAADNAPSTQPRAVAPQSSDPNAPPQPQDGDVWW